MPRLRSLPLLVLLLFVVPAPAYAACSALTNGLVAVQRFDSTGNATVATQSTAAATATVEGAMAYDSVADKLYVCDGANWTQVGGSSSPCSPADVQTFNGNGTWTKPSCGTTALLECWGGGGGGGGSIGNYYDWEGNHQKTSGGVGAGGVYLSKLLPLNIFGATETVTVGAGGTAGVASGNGGNGGNSSIGSWLTARGGGGGIAITGVHGTTLYPDDIAGKGCGGISSCGGGAGGCNVIAGGTSGCGGNGGNGAGNTNEGGGQSGTAPGGGGGAALSNWNTYSGGAGAAGRCRVTVY